MGIFDSFKFSEVERNMPLGILRFIPNVRIKLISISSSSAKKFDLQQWILSILQLLKWKYVQITNRTVYYKSIDDSRYKNVN